MPNYRPMSTDPTTGAKVVTAEDIRAQTAWPAGKTFGELTPAQRRAAMRAACRKLETELQAMAPAIGAVLEGDQ